MLLSKDLQVYYPNIAAVLRVHGQKFVQKISAVKQGSISSIIRHGREGVPENVASQINRACFDKVIISPESYGAFKKDPVPCLFLYEGDSEGRDLLDSFMEGGDDQ